MQDLLAPIFTPDPLVRHHRLAPDHWWIVLPGLDGGKFWYDIGAASGLAHGTLTNMAAASGWRGSTRLGGFGHLVFDGTDDYVDLGKPPSLNLGATGTVCAWIRTSDTIPTYPVVLSNGNFSVNVNEYMLLATYLELGDGAGFIQTTPRPTLASNRWYHICGTWDGVTARFYVDGAQVGSVAQSLTPSPGSSGVSARVGGSNYAFGYWLGCIDDVQARPRALSAAEVRALYDESRLGYPNLLRRVGRPLGGSAAAILFRRNLMLRAGSRGGGRVGVGL